MRQDPKAAESAGGVDAAPVQLLGLLQALMALLPLGRLLADRAAAGGDDDGLSAGGTQQTRTAGIPTLLFTHVMMYCVVVAVV
jgi:hypothetical protein